MPTLRTLTLALALTGLLLVLVAGASSLFFGVDLIGTFPPLALFDTFSADKRAVYVDDYQCGPYLLDPFYLACTRAQP